MTTKQIRKILSFADACYLWLEVLDVNLEGQTAKTVDTNAVGAVREALRAIRENATMAEKELPAALIACISAAKPTPHKPKTKK